MLCRLYTYTRVSADYSVILMKSRLLWNLIASIFKNNRPLSLPVWLNHVFCKNVLVLLLALNIFYTFFLVLPLFILKREMFSG